MTQPGALEEPGATGKAFYERWAERRVDPVEADYIWQADAWKWRHLERLIRRRLDDPASILEFGCGSGEMLELAGRSFPAAELHGIDLAERMIDMARARLPGAHLVVGGEEALEALAPPVELVLAIDILEHLAGPRRAARGLAHAGRWVALKIPLERRVLRLGFRRRAGGAQHVAGHLHFWTLADSRRLLHAAGLEIVDELIADPPESVRYHAAVLRPPSARPAPPLGGLRRAHHAFEVAVERWSCRRAPGLHRRLFGTNHFVLARARGGGV